MSKVLIEDEKLVEMVARFNCLYDLSCAIYSNQTVKDNAWKEVAEQVKRSGKNIVIYYNYLVLQHIIIILVYYY